MTSNSQATCPHQGPRAGRQMVEREFAKRLEQALATQSLSDESTSTAQLFIKRIETALMNGDSGTQDTVVADDPHSSAKGPPIVELPNRPTLSRYFSPLRVRSARDIAAVARAHLGRFGLGRIRMTVAIIILLRARCCASKTSTTSCGACTRQTSTTSPPFENRRTRSSRRSFVSWTFQPQLTSSTFAKRAGQTGVTMPIDQRVRAHKTEREQKLGRLQAEMFDSEMGLFLPGREELESMRISSSRAARARGVDIAGQPEPRGVITAMEAARKRGEFFVGAHVRATSQNSSTFHAPKLSASTPRCTHRSMPTSCTRPWKRLGRSRRTP